MTPLITLLTRAKQVGLTLHRDRDRLVVRGNPTAAHLGGELIARKKDLFACDLLPLYQGVTEGLDWRAASIGEMAPCLLCGRPALCREPYDGRSCHKVCAEEQLKPSKTA